MKTTRVYRSDSPACKGELWLPKEPITADTPKMLLIHGGGFNWKQPDHFRVVYLPRVEVLKEAAAGIADFFSYYHQ